MIPCEHNQYLLARCESPAERAVVEAMTFPAPETLDAQHWIQPVRGHTFRVDFAIPSKKIAIEIDGHIAHHTKAQRTADARRERLLQYGGWVVFRFTASEVSFDPYSVAREIFTLCKPGVGR